MFSSIATFRADLDALIKPSLPESWETVPKLHGVITSLAPVIYFEFTELNTADPTGPLGRGAVYASCDLIISDPQTGDGAENAVDQHVVSLIAALDGHDEINWDIARKQRLSPGPLAWRVSVHALVSTALPE
jgi:hypothetical protein